MVKEPILQPCSQISKALRINKGYMVRLQLRPTNHLPQWQKISSLRLHRTVKENVQKTLLNISYPLSLDFRFKIRVESLWSNLLYLIDVRSLYVQVAISLYSSSTAPRRSTSHPHSVVDYTLYYFFKVSLGFVVLYSRSLTIKLDILYIIISHNANKDQIF